MAAAHPILIATLLSKLSLLVYLLHNNMPKTVIITGARLF